MLLDRYGTQLIVPKRKNMKEQDENPIDKTTSKICAQNPKSGRNG